MPSFQHVVLPAVCPCGEVTVPVSLADLTERPVEVDCGGCGQKFVIDARENAVRLTAALASGSALAVENGLNVCTVAFHPET